ncbi:MAG: hypothetical protein PWP31_155 [Clostridia bacterium]|nr:hypothetical protein [Clostridia bacterium]
MDNAATSWPKPPEVSEAMVNFMKKTGANPGRSGHRLSIEAGRVLYEAREAVASLLGIKNPMQVVFTLNVTEALNLALLGLLEPGDHVITSSMEHNSVSRPLRYLEEKGVELTIVQCSSTGHLEPQDVRTAVRANTRMIVLTHASNVIGTLLPLKEVGNIARECELIFVVDAAQTAGCYPIDVSELNIDLLAFAGHKAMLGPQGTGGLYVAESVKLSPLKRGGTGSRSEFDIQPEFLPDQFESGTPNTVGVAGLGAGVRFILEQGVETVRRHEVLLTKRLLDGLNEIEGVTIYGPLQAEEQAPVVAFNINGLEPSDVGFALDRRYGIMTRVGLHCAPWAHRTIGTYPRGTVRLSLGWFNTTQDVDYVLEAIAELCRQGHHGFVEY